MARKSIRLMIQEAARKPHVGIGSVLEDLISVVGDMEQAKNEDYLRRLRVDLEVAVLNYRARYSLGFGQIEQSTFEDKIRAAK